MLSLGYLFYREDKFAIFKSFSNELAKRLVIYERYAQLTDFLVLAGATAIDEGDSESAAHNYLQGILASFAAGGIVLLIMQKLKARCTSKNSKVFGSVS